MAERIDLTEAPLPPAMRSRRKRGSGTGSPKVDAAARNILGLASLVTGLLVLYLLWGLWSGAWSHEVMATLPKVARWRQLDNIHLVFRLLQLSSVVTIAALLVCCARAEGVGYWLLGAAAFFYAGPAFVTAQVYPLTHHTSAVAGTLVIAGFQGLSWLFTVPGVLWTLVDIGRRLATAAETAAVQRANAKYGAGVKKQEASTQRQVFLGRCWEGPFCKDHIREKCPIFIEKRGPCWQRKEGCMCEERIVLQAMIAPDWKDQMTRANQALTMGSGPRKILTPAAKRDRCRNCIIYNEHQRQKQKALTTLALVAIPALLFANLTNLQNVVTSGLKILDAAMKRFSFGADPAGLSIMHSNEYGAVLWVLVGTCAIILLSQVLKLIDYCCFTLKI